MDIKELLEKLTVEEKAALVAGTDFMFTNPVPRLSIKSIETSDGPHGLRKQCGKGDNGISESLPSTAFPTAATTACGWSEDNLKKMGEAIAEECLYYGVNVVLGPGANIKRNPRGGRNFEYFSEDAYLSGKLAAAEVKGIQSKGVCACVKHFALNNSENFRFMGNSVCDMRAMREIYLRSFERVIKEAKPHTVMCAYNQINGTFCSENEWLLNEVLRGEWGFDGLVMTDWGATHDRVEGIKAGLDLEMPGDTPYCRKSIIDGVKSGSLPIEKLDKAVENVLRLLDKCGDEKSGTVDFKAHDRLSADIAADCAVLLKNDGVLPLNASDSFFVCGELFEKMRYQGAGSSMINPVFLTSPKTAFDKRGVDYEYFFGYRENELKADPTDIWQAQLRSEEYDKIIVFAGLTDYVESEGADRESLSLPENQLELIDALTEAGKKVVVVLFGGSVIELPFADKVSAILNMSLPGQNGGTAAAELLFGDKTPCGKLAETWVNSLSDVPFDGEFSKGINEVYKESIFVGYRYYL
ncbi:MAG: glycoside hydrolase family 3 C-terminal domain-containing protein, partial [Clostridia bacterium]|nr:glycoside hydrolase family 3 C-terminal domain-containing protein [Clostridia bacterium]